MRILTTAALLAALIAGIATPAQAHDTGDQRKVLQSRPLPDMAGKQAVMLTVSYAPGQVSAAHVHPGSTFAYVLEGSVVSQLEGEAPVTYKAGESWYEAPHTPHLVSRNASKTKPAKLLVWLISNEGETVVKPLEK